MAGLVLLKTIFFEGGPTPATFIEAFGFFFHRMKILVPPPPHLKLINEWSIALKTNKRVTRHLDSSILKCNVQVVEYPLLDTKIEVQFLGKLASLQNDKLTGCERVQRVQECAKN